MNIDILREQLAAHEAPGKVPVLKPYRDTKGKLTVGFGHNLDDNGITEQTAWFILEEDMNAAIQALGRYPWVEELTEVRQRVLANMMFNLGPTRFAGFKKMIAAAKRGDAEAVAAEMLDSQWHRDVGMRATVLAQMYRSSKDPT